MDLWKQLQDWKTECEWVEMSHEFSPETPHWVGFPPMQVENFLNLKDSIFLTDQYTVVSQYGTHVDSPNHMVEGARALHEVGLHEMAMPLCVIDKAEAVAKNADYVLRLQDILDFEEQYGRIPESAFVVFRSDWSKRPPEDFDNLDAEGNRHFPGWSLEAVDFLCTKRGIGGLGHETSDTECPLTSGKTSYEVERAILAYDHIQVELLKNVDQCPPTGAIFFATFPRLKGGSGFSARCFAICPK